MLKVECQRFDSCGREPARYLRIDPLFPRNPLLNGKTMVDFGLPDVQPMSDMDALIKICHESACVGSFIHSEDNDASRIGRLSALWKK